MCLLVDQVEGLPKTVTSRRPIPMSSELARALGEWRKRTEYAGDDDWVFASPQSVGKTSHCPSSIMKRHVLPAATRAGIAKHIGWHTFRRTLATVLLSSGASIRTSQELLRHASPTMTLGVYAKALTQDKRQAQQNVVSMLVGNQDAENAA